MRIGALAGRLMAVAGLALLGCTDAADALDVHSRCPLGCEVALDTLVHLGAAEDSLWPTVIARAVRAHGRYYVGGIDHPNTVAVYSDSGRLLFTLGREGNGPGEFASNYLVPALTHDTVSIIDILESRRTVLGQGGQMVRTHAVPHQFNRLAQVGRRLIVQSDVRTPERAGLLLHEIDSIGVVLRSFAEVPVYRGPADGYAPITPSIDGGLWLASGTEYRITHFDSLMNITHVLSPQARWYELQADGAEAQEAPRAASIWQSPDSTLWVLFRVVAPGWKPRNSVGVAFTIDYVNRKNDWRLEALDARTGARLATMKLTNATNFGIGDGILYSLAEELDGRVRMTAQLARLEQRRRR